MRALLVQLVISIALLLGVFGPKLFDATAVGNPFEDLIDVTAAVFWILFLLTGIALFVLRYREPNRPRPFPVPGYPVIPILFCICCAYMVYGSVTYRPIHSLIGLAIAVAGLPLYYLPTRLHRESAEAPTFDTRLKSAATRFSG